jgi:hypothetical protein
MWVIDCHKDCGRESDNLDNWPLHFQWPMIRPPHDRKLGFMIPGMLLSFAPSLLCAIWLLAELSPGMALSETPSSKRTEWAKTALDHCHKYKKTSGSPMKCSRSKRVWYCSRECQKREYQAHKALCKSSAVQPEKAKEHSGVTLLQWYHLRFTAKQCHRIDASQDHFRDSCVFRDNCAG